jgi:hypothetical protein
LVFFSGNTGNFAHFLTIGWFRNIQCKVASQKDYILGKYICYWCSELSKTQRIQVFATVFVTIAYILCIWPFYYGEIRFEVLKVWDTLTFEMGSYLIALEQCWDELLLYPSP